MRGSGALALILLLVAGPAPADPPTIPPLVPLAGPAPARARFRDWSLACAPECHALTRLRSTAPGTPEVLRLAIGPTEATGWAADAGWALTLRTPLPLYLPDPLSLTVEPLPPISIPWFTCSPKGCEARLTAGPDLVAALRDGRRAEVEVTLVSGEHARLALSLRGLGAATKAAAALTP